jgi:hypothetical protein
MPISYIKTVSSVASAGNLSGSGIVTDPVGLKPDVILTSLTVSGAVSSPAYVTGNLNNYFEINVKNANTGTAASSDFVATSNNGSDTTSYVDLGINSNTFNGTIGSAGDAYLYNTGSNLWIGNATPNKNIYFFAGAPVVASTSAPTLMISASANGATGSVGIGTKTPSSKLHVAGGNIQVDDSYGIVFGSSQSAQSGTFSSLSFSEYERGTFTPSIKFVSFTSTNPNNIISGSVTAGGNYERVGNKVFVDIFITITNFNTGSMAGSSGDPMILTGLPFDQIKTGNYTTPTFIEFSGLPLTYTNIILTQNTNTAYPIASSVWIQTIGINTTGNTSNSAYITRSIFTAATYSIYMRAKFNYTTS